MTSLPTPLDRRVASFRSSAPFLAAIAELGQQQPTAPDASTDRPAIAASPAR